MTIEFCPTCKHHLESCLCHKVKEPNGKCRHGGGRQGARCVHHCGNAECVGPVPEDEALLDVSIYDGPPLKSKRWPISQDPVTQLQVAIIVAERGGHPSTKD